MLPGINEFFRIKFADGRGDFGEFEQPRARGNEQANRELNGRDGGDQIAIRNELEQVEITGASGPRSECNESRLQGQAGVIAKIDGTKKIGAGVTLFEFTQNLVVKRLYGAGDEETAGTSKNRESIGMAKKMFDFYGGVVGKLREFRVKQFNNPRGVGDAIKEIGIAKGDVPGAGLDLLADIRENIFERDDAKLSGVDRNDRAMAAEMFAAS